MQEQDNTLSMNLDKLETGWRIKELRMAQNISVAELAQAAHVSKSLISQVERAEVYPSLKTLEKIASALKVNVGDFFQGESLMKRAFILNDYTNDLISEEGALFCGLKAQAIAPAICSYLEEFAVAGDYIAVCLDTHFPDDSFHPETKLFPAHNIKNSHGHLLYNSVAQKIASISERHPKQIIIIEKNRYSAFVGTKLDIWLRSRGVTHITVSGVCTDMCVLHTVIDAYGLGYKVTVPRAVCYSPNEEGEQFALEHFQTAMGVEVIF
ncbi:MAG: isochorismatase family protein [Firmicutes bacterium]|nr:isochorismatase family protein [Bacillota bacterium]